MEAIVLVKPKENRLTGVSFTFMYGIDGNRYGWPEVYFMGPDGYTWFIVSVSVLGAVGLLIIVSVIMCLVKCIHAHENKNKVHDISEVRKLNDQN